MIQPPPFTYKEIVAKAEALVDEFAHLRGGREDLVRFGLSFDRVYEDLIYPAYGIVLDEKTDLGNDEEGEKILGFFEPVPNKAFIDVSLRRDPRRAFTRWHEVGGHAFLQGDWLRKELKKRGVATTDHDLSPETEKVLERQANLFAAHAAAPTWLVVRIMEKVFRLKRPFRYIGAGHYCLDVNGHSQKYNVSDVDDLSRAMALNIQCYFGHLSKEALGYRIRDTGCINDQSDSVQGNFRLYRKSKATISVGV